MPTGTAPDEDQDRLLQRLQTQRATSERDVRLPRILFPTARGMGNAKRATVLRLHTSGQLLGAESDAGKDQGLAHPSTDAALVGRHRPVDQSAPQGVDQLLWTIRADGAAAHISLRQSDGACVGKAEVQALWQG